MSHEDYTWIQHCLSGDKNAFKPLVEKYQQSIFGTIYKMVFDPELTRDLTQEVFVKVYTRLNTYDPRYPFKVWIHRIAIHRAIDFLRKKRPEQLIFDDDNNSEKPGLKHILPDPSDTPDISVERKEIADRVHHAIHQLDHKLKTVVVLRHFQEMSYDQISNVLNVPMGTVKNRLFRAREELQRTLLNQQLTEREESER